MTRGRMPYRGAMRFVQRVALLFALIVAAPALAADKLVVALGDSLVAGYGLSQSQAFPARLESALRKSGIAARVHNAGVSGDTSAAGRARLNWVLRGVGAKPDLVIVELGANDMLRGLKAAETRANLDAILAELQRRRIPVLLAGMRAAPNMGRAYVVAFEGVYPALAKKYRVGLYPFFMEGVATRRPLLQADGMHPNASGVDAVVKAILPSVRRALVR